MAESLEGKVALVTGGGRGLGEAICRTLDAAGAAVAVADVRREAAEAVAAQLRNALALCLDVGDEAHAAEAVRAAVSSNSPRSQRPLAPLLADRLRRGGPPPGPGERLAGAVHRQPLGQRAPEGVRGTGSGVRRLCACGRVPGLVCYSRGRFQEAGTGVNATGGPDSRNRRRFS